MDKESEFENKLKGGKALSLGKTIEVVNEVVEKPETFSEYLLLFSSEDSQVVMRASNGLKRILEDGAISFRQHKRTIVELLSNCPHDSARWTLIQLLKKYSSSLSGEELSEARSLAKRFTLESEEWITLTQSMDLLVKLEGKSAEDKKLVERVRRLCDDDRKTVSRKARTLLKLLERGRP